MTAIDFLLSAAAIAPVLDQAPLRRVGDTILDCIRATRKVTNVNTNLGIVLLLAPLASVQPHLDLRGGVMRALMRLDVADARAAYEAIRLAQPGGLGTVAEQDVAAEPTVTLREAMALAADRDLIARQYVNDFEQVFEGAEILRRGTAAALEPTSAEPSLDYSCETAGQVPGQLDRPASTVNEPPTKCQREARRFWIASDGPIRSRLR